MVKLHEDSLERKLLEECCNENDIKIEEILEFMELEDEYATKSRRHWITEKLKDIIEYQFTS